MIAGLLVASVIGCAWLYRAPRHGIAEMLAATLALSPLMTIGVMVLTGGHA